MSVESLKLTDAQERHLLDGEIARGSIHGSNAGATDWIRSALHGAAAAGRVMASLRASARAARVDFSEG